ncbi:L-xylulose reductase [Trichogramma pretiosum]|uniref:L-xylulose reductase n=1 Tax=Trichogramma pretiosum TaxID=7493 RepID=UPI0006C93D4D|nr:L-xylulose reductase [Trichogramma pretiosum]XP_014237483.1 L-xylulose reductase [Trichogramma pretiosum]
MNISFEGKRILVTGAGQGIGRETALRLSKFKGTVIALSKTQKNLDSLVKEDPRIQTVCADLGDWAATRRAVKSVLPIDLLVNNAGIARLDPFLTAKPEDFDDTFNVNLKSIMNVSQVVAADMVARKVPGSIVNLSSQASLVAITDHATYCASKAALDMLTKVMALELGPHNIRVNTVNPTLVLTAMGRAHWSDPAKANSLRVKIPLGRFAEPEEVVDSIVFLLSDKSSMTTGTGVTIDGGYTIQ